jgi:peptidoglycan hydrolase CwlO-like protein
MSNLENKEKNLNNLIDKISNLSLSYTQSQFNTGNVILEKKQLESEKKEIEKKHEELILEHKYLKDKLLKLQNEVNQKSELEEKFNQDIDELSQETENLVEEIEKWQM